MDLVEALHVAARRYCAERSAYWHDRYTELLAEEARTAHLAGSGEPKRYSRAALATFPRYNALEAILPAIEAFTPVDLGSLDEARELLAVAGDTADSRSRAVNRTATSGVRSAKSGVASAASCRI